jgi:glutathione S-transferase
MAVRLYALAVSHPAQAARLMLEHKGIEHTVSYLLPGLHPVQLRAARFRGATVPALKADGARVQGSREIARALEELVPDPPLFPADPAGRRQVEEAERWGEQELQDIPRRIFRWATAHQQAVRRWLGEVVGLPGAGVAGALNLPVARAFARRSQATESRVRSDIEKLPQTLDHVDQLISRAVIGGRTPNAADFQIAPSLRLLMAFEQLSPALEARPAGELAMRLLPRVPEPVPAHLPPAWLGPVRAEPSGGPWNEADP